MEKVGRELVSPPFGSLGSVTPAFLMKVDSRVQLCGVLGKALEFLSFCQSQVKSCKAGAAGALWGRSKVIGDAVGKPSS